MSSVVDTLGRRRRPTARRRARRHGEGLLAALFLAPALLLIGLFVLWPVAWSLKISFTDYTLLGPGATNHRFVGFDNYTRLLQDPGFGHAITRTGIFVFASAVVGQFVLGMIAALALTRRDIRGRAFFGTAIILPLAVPETVAALVWASMFAVGDLGTANRLLGVVGFGPIEWIADHALLSVILVNVWRGTAFAAILFNGALEAIPREVLEAARMDGASPLQAFIHVTLPLMKHAILIYMLMTVVGTVTVFGLVYFLTQGGPGDDTTIASIYVYLRSFKFFEFGIGSAASVLILAFVMPLGILYVRLLRTRV